LSDNRSSELIPFLVERIIRRFDPLRIVLFGSHARGDAGPDSDIDLLVVFHQVDDKRKAAIEIRRALAGLPVGKDIIVTTPEEIARRGNLIGTILRPALRDGKVLYDRA
jgi:predicted nucleotidyltransferase